MASHVLSIQGFPAKTSLLRMSRYSGISLICFNGQTYFDHKRSVLKNLYTDSSTPPTARATQRTCASEALIYRR